jgi:hypothetical protein
MAKIMSHKKIPFLGYPRNGICIEYVKAVKVATETAFVKSLI